MKWLDDAFHSILCLLFITGIHFALDVIIAFIPLFFGVAIAERHGELLQFSGFAAASATLLLFSRFRLRELVIGATLFGLIAMLPFTWARLFNDTFSGGLTLALCFAFPPAILRLPYFADLRKRCGSIRITSRIVNALCVGTCLGGYFALPLILSDCLSTSLISDNMLVSLSILACAYLPLGAAMRHSRFPFAEIMSGFGLFQLALLLALLKGFLVFVLFFLFTSVPFAIGLVAARILRREKTAAGKMETA